MTPDVLLIDEVLAVGDRGFRVKCFNRISEIQDDCATILVSHNMIDIQSNCDMVIVLESGRIKHYGEKLSGIRIYNSLCSENQNFNVVSPMGIELITFMLNTPEIGWRDNLRFRVELNSPIEVNECILRIVFRDTTSLENLAEWRSIHHGENVQINFGKNVMEGCIEDIHLGAGDYIVDLIIASENDIIQFLATEGYNLLFVNSNIYGHTVYQI
jgi:lipopolysaccharide transport system ATP-binding protein